MVKLEYTPTEDDIVRKIEVGNVNMPLNSSLITGAQSLFWCKDRIAIWQDQGDSNPFLNNNHIASVVAQGGGTVEEFEFL